MKSILKYWVVPVLLCIVAIYQIYMSQTTLLTPWKGGGFGMYTTIHPNTNIVKINDSAYSLSNPETSLPKRDRENLKSFFYNPTKQNLNLFMESRLGKIQSNQADIKLLNFRVNYSNNIGFYENSDFQISDRQD